MIQVQFPHLPSQSQPPTDSEVTTATTTTSTTATATTSSSDQEVSDMENSKSTTTTARRCSSDPDTEGSDQQQQDEHNGPAAAAGGAASRLKSPPEKSSQPSQQHPHQASSNVHQDNINATTDHSDTDNEEDMMMEIEIDTLDFTSHPDPAQHQVGTDASVVAANQIRSALTKLVVTVKRRRKRQQEKKKKKAQQQQQQQQPEQQQQQQHGHHQVTAKEVGGPQEVHEGGSHNQEGGRSREDRKPSLKQRPIQTIMTWMDSFQDHENIQVRFFGFGCVCYLLHLCFDNFTCYLLGIYIYIYIYIYIRTDTTSLPSEQCNS